MDRLSLCRRNPGNPGRCNERSFQSSLKRKRATGSTGGRKRRNGRDGAAAAGQDDDDDDDSGIEEADAYRRLITMIPDDGFSFGSRPLFILEVAVSETMDHVMRKISDWFSAHSSTLLAALVVSIPEIKKPQPLPKKSLPLLAPYDDYMETGENGYEVKVEGEAPGPFKIGGEPHSGTFSRVVLRLIRLLPLEAEDPHDTEHVGNWIPGQERDGILRWTSTPNHLPLLVETVVRWPWDGTSQEPLPTSFTDRTAAVGAALRGQVLSWYQQRQWTGGKLESKTAEEVFPDMSVFDEDDWEQLVINMADGMKQTARERWLRRAGDRDAVRRRAIAKAEGARLPSGGHSGRGAITI